MQGARTKGSKLNGQLDAFQFFNLTICMFVSPWFFPSAICAGKQAGRERNCLLDV